MTRLTSLIGSTCACLFVAWTGTASAQDQGTQRVGDQARAWMDLQASGTEASEAERPITGEVAERVYQRYLDSFTHPIPRQFTREAFTSDGEN